ncbi:MAG TPA: vitamin K epoxide reductase family protein [Chloroflexota bacterium]|nr:vitamin K epoxide reductase family protein [Chloroflexota bacterium]
MTPETVPTIFRSRARTISALAILGIAVSGYLTWVHYSGGLALCAGIGGCEQVQTSHYAILAGIPVATLGLLMYVTLFGLSLSGTLNGGSPPGLPLLGLFGFALAGTLFSAYLTYVELFVLNAICPWCVVLAVLVTAILVLVVGEMRRWRSIETYDGR